MKKYILLFIALCFYPALNFATTFIVTNIGNSFSPSTITINSGDTVDFQIASIHSVSEVSFATWTVDGNTPLSGGFSIGLGGGKIKITAVGTHYYVCDQHYFLGMKAIIIVIPAQGLINYSYNSDKNLNVYPNPSVGTFYIDYTLNQQSKVEISLIDISGRVKDIIISDERYPGKYSENINRIYAPGLYFVRYTTKNSSAIAKVLIQ